MNELKFFTTPTSADAFDVFWTTGRHKQGVFHVAVSDKRPNKDAIAELSAAQHLIDVNGAIGDRSRGGAAITLTFSVPEVIPVIKRNIIDRLHGTESKTPHLMDYTRFFQIRFSGAQFELSRDSSWIVPARTKAREETIIADMPRPTLISVRGVGDVAVRMHIIDRLMQRAAADEGRAWTLLNRVASSSSLAEVNQTPEEKKAATEKHGQAGRVYIDPATGWGMVIVDDGGLPTMVTVIGMTPAAARRLLARAA